MAGMRFILYEQQFNILCLLFEKKQYATFNTEATSLFFIDRSGALVDFTTNIQVVSCFMPVKKKSRQLLSHPKAEI